MDTIAAMTPLLPRPLRIVLAGGSGQVGQVLARHFTERGDQVIVLTRGPYTAPWLAVHWDGENRGPWTEYLEGADACINLAGRSVNCRYTAENREAIYESRTRSTQLLGRVIAGLAEPPRVWMNASAATIYARAMDANGADLPVDEMTGRMDADAPSFRVEPAARWGRRKGFSKRVARDWEAAFFAAETPRTRKIALRSGVVLSPAAGSAFAVLSRLVRLGLGGTQGNGDQFVPWIHEADYARAVEFLIAREPLDGPVNLVAPNPLPNREFMAALREAWDVPNGLPAPSLAIKLGAIFLRTEPELVLESCRAVPGRLLDAGFEFEFPEWPASAEDLVRQWKNKE
jgi:NAD dependent epimerase/dehydratase family enzyme